MVSLYFIFVLAVISAANAYPTKNSVLDDTAFLVDQQQELDDKDFIFDLQGSTPTVQGEGGDQFVMSRENTKGLRLSNGRNGGGGEQVLFEFAPCGFRTPHFHPRGTENFFIIEGDVLAHMIREDGRPVHNLVHKGFSGFFPQAHIHFLFNVGCRNATTVAIFDNSDPGVYDVAPILRGPADTTELTLGKKNLKANDAVIERIIQLSKKCLKRCGLSHKPEYKHDEYPEHEYEGYPEY